MSSNPFDSETQDNSNSNSPSLTENKKKRKAKDPAPSDETRRNNHKLIEQRRRKKINDKLEELRVILSALDSQNPSANHNPSPGSLQGNDHPNKSSILDNTIVAIRHLQQVAIKLAIQHRQLQYETIHLRKVLAKASRAPPIRTQLPQKHFIDGYSTTIPSSNNDFAATSPRLGSPPMPPPLTSQLQGIAMYPPQQRHHDILQNPLTTSSFPPYRNQHNSGIPSPLLSSSNSSNSNSSSSSTDSTPRGSVSSLADVAMQHKLWELIRMQDLQQPRPSLPSLDNIDNSNNASSTNSSQQQNSQI